MQAEKNITGTESCLFGKDRSEHVNLRNLGRGGGLRQDIFPQIVFWRVGKEGAITVSVLELHQLPSIMVATHLC